MRYITALLLFSNVLIASGQETEKDQVKNTIDAFFEGFHQQDSIAIKKTVTSTIVLQTIGKTEDGDNEVKTEDFNSFLKAIVSIPKTTVLNEKILSYHIQIDGPMAHVWTPYEFWVNEKFSHCGVNSFQLFKENGKDWKIIYLIDTRRPNACPN